MESSYTANQLPGPPAKAAIGKFPCSGTMLFVTNKVELPSPNNKFRFNIRCDAMETTAIIIALIGWIDGPRV